MLRKYFQRSLLFHVIIYLSPKCLKSIEKVKKTDFFKKQGFRQSWTKVPPDSTAIFIFFCYFSVLSLLKQCSVFEILLQFSLPPSYTKLKLGKKILDTGVQHVIFCRRTLHLCDRYPFSLLVNSVSAVSGRDFMVVKLLLYFFLCVLQFFFCVVLICFCFVLFFVFCFVWLFVCCCFCFLFLLKYSLLLID